MWAGNYYISQVFECETIFLHNAKWIHKLYKIQLASIVIGLSSQNPSGINVFSFKKYLVLEKFNKIKMILLGAIEIQG